MSVFLFLFYCAISALSLFLLMYVVFNPRHAHDKLKYVYYCATSRYKVVDEFYLSVHSLTNELSHVTLGTVYINEHEKFSNHPIFYFSDGVYVPNDLNSRVTNITYICKVLGASLSQLSYTTENGLLVVHVGEHLDSNNVTADMIKKRDSTRRSNDNY